MTNNLQQKLHTEIIKIITIKKVHATQIHNAVCYMHKKYGIAWILIKREDNFFLAWLRFFLSRSAVNKVCGLLRNGWRTIKWVIRGRCLLNIIFIFLWPLIGLELQLIQSLEAAVSSLTSSQKPNTFLLHRIKPTFPPPKHILLFLGT